VLTTKIVALLISARLALGSIKEMNDEDHVPSRGATAYAIFATHAMAHVGTGKASNRAHGDTRLAFGSRLQGYRIVAREFAIPAWSFACMNDQGPQSARSPCGFTGAPTISRNLEIHFDMEPRVVRSA
jgi:hypothetical protein